MTISFASDNASGAHPAVMAAIAEANQGRVMAYGDDSVTQGLAARFAELFEHDCTVYPVSTGTAANALALSQLSPPHGAIYCHREAHLNVDECGAPELFTGGAKLIPVDGEAAKVTPEALEAAIFGAGDVHQAQPAALSISQSTELGTLYRPAEIAELAAVAKRHRLAFHMDGARFANAVAALGCRPAEITQKVGIDALSFGATKNGCIAAEAVVFFDREKAEGFTFRRKRAGQLLSKMRFVSAQLAAYLEDDLWLANAAHANAMATRLGAGLADLPSIRLAAPVEANEVFAYLPEDLASSLRAEGFVFGDWGRPEQELRRFVTGFDTQETDVHAMLAVIGRFVHIADINGLAPCLPAHLSSQS